MAQIKCRAFANRTTKRVFTASDVGRIAKYALQDGATEKDLVIQVALRVGKLHDILVYINDLVQKVLPVINTIRNVVSNVIFVVDKLNFYLVRAGIVLSFLGLGEVLLTISARLKILEKDLEKLDEFVADTQDLVQNFDISEIIANSIQVKGK
jgi:hypothetical protein